MGSEVDELLIEIDAYNLRQSITRKLIALESPLNVRSGIYHGESTIDMLQGNVWAAFRSHLTTAKEAEDEYSKTFEDVKDRLNPEQFWSHVARADLWVDLRLPKDGGSTFPSRFPYTLFNGILDMKLRTSVIYVNACRDAAFEFYHKRRKVRVISSTAHAYKITRHFKELVDYHQKRLNLVNDILGIPSNMRCAPGTNTYNRLIQIFSPTKSSIRCAQS